MAAEPTDVLSPDRLALLKEQGPEANLVLVGFMGAGKSAVGRLLAKALGRFFVDADEVIVARAGRSIPEIFQEEGEAGFRQRERVVVRQLAKLRGAVIATGGGAVADEGNWEALAEGGVMVWLKAPLDVLLARAGVGGARKGRILPQRPLTARGEEALADLYRFREPIYAKAHWVVNTDRRTPDEVAQVICQALREAGWAGGGAGAGPSPALAPPEALHVDLGERSYPIWIGGGLLPRVGPLLDGIGVGRRILVITQPGIEGLYADGVLHSLETAGFQASLATMPGGEAAKTLRTVEQLYSEAVKAGLDRSSAVLALGGGVVGDVAGMVAATFMRGIDFIQVPTTLLAQVDAAVGGKVGVNLPEGKNLVGAFHQPRAVIADTNTLLSLPGRELAAGLAEVAKHGFIADPRLLDHLEEHAGAIKDREGEPLAHCIWRSCEIKADVVRRDERESGIRAWLNFGHTFAHGLEAAGGYGQLLHGEAVAIGMVAALRLSERLGWMEQGASRRAEALLTRLGLPVHATGVDVQRAWEAMHRDKKAEAGRLRLVLLRGWGRPEVAGDVPEEDVRWALESVCAGAAGSAGWTGPGR